MGLLESSGEVAGGSGIGNAARPKGVEERIIVAATLDVTKARAVAQWVVNDVEDVVGFVMGRMDFEQVKTLIDGLGQAESVCEYVGGPDASWAMAWCR